MREKRLDAEGEPCLTLAVSGHNGGTEPKTNRDEKHGCFAHSEGTKMRNILTAVLCAAACLASAASAMEVRTSTWARGTVFEFYFSADECRQLIASPAFADQKAREIFLNMSTTSGVIELSNGGPDVLGLEAISKPVGLLIAQGVLARKLRNLAKDVVAEYGNGEPIPWSLPLKRLDALARVIGL
jgi:hypothetical protein